MHNWSTSNDPNSGFANIPFDFPTMVSLRRKLKDEELQKKKDEEACGSLQ